MYCAVRTLDGKIALNSFNGTAWTGFDQTVPGATTSSVVRRLVLRQFGDLTPGV
ncbi:hypothetical protein [Embleya sp. NBC_00896]|uniref:hypothetical protein n=1 Tax=Embleya sp. NBC_00896 TaxID=2975961 RepID=UPI003865DB95|nr:hypothetical protein OG928_06105 [Embleya sp. NBC_00896]